MNEGDTDLTILSFIISNPCSYRAKWKKLEDRVSMENNLELIRTLQISPKRR